MKFQKLFFIILILSSTLLFAQNENQSNTQSADEEAAALAKATQNPLAAMYSLPFQNNTTLEGSDVKQNVLNIQPVIPIGLGENINLINRVIIPVISQDQSTTGVGDISYTAWLAPTKVSKIIWGVGPVFQIPTSSGSEFGSGEFGIGPSVVALTTLNQWVAGIVINNVWTFGEAKENKFLFQYFVNYNLPKAWYLVSAPILTANWNAPSGEQWIVPFGGGAGKVFKIGKLPININVQAYYNAVTPDNYEGDWQMRLQVQFLFPKK